VSKTTKSILWLAAALVAAGALLLPRLDFPAASEAGAAPAAEPLEVETLVMTPHRLVERFATVGTIRADEQIELRSEISGVLREIRFSEGSAVARGQLLVQIDDAEFVAERDRARHLLELARLREARQQDLLAQGLTSQEEYDLALSRLNVLHAELRLAEAELEKTQIRAPFGGVIGLRSVSRGAALTPQMPIARLQKIDTVKIEFSVPEGQAGRVRVGETITFRVKGTERDQTAEIYALEPSVDSETRSLRARARCANSDGALRPGAFADVELAINAVEDALTVPAIAIIPELGSKKVFVAEQGKAAPRLVETGVRTDTEVQITRGLEAGDRVIVSAIQRLSSGQPVREAGPQGEP
jgi:membrane fusion protein (multidrug efflux system)